VAGAQHNPCDDAGKPDLVIGRPRGNARTCSDIRQYIADKYPQQLSRVPDYHPLSSRTCGMVFVPACRSSTIINSARTHGTLSSHCKFLFLRNFEREKSMIYPRNFRAIGASNVIHSISVGRHAEVPRLNRRTLTGDISQGDSCKQMVERQMLTSEPSYFNFLMTNRGFRRAPVSFRKGILPELQMGGLNRDDFPIRHQARR
jgi:hypothetical protein